MSGMSNVKEGYRVYTSDNQLLGTVEQLHGDGIHVNGQHIPSRAIARVAQNSVYLRGASSEYTQATGRQEGMTARTEGEIRVPVAEERLDVQKQAGELGAVEIHKTVTEEQQTIPVELRREEVHVERRDIADRPISAADADRIFEEGTIRVPVHGEEAIVTKEAVVTGEVVVNKEQTTERQQVTDTVRREQVEVDENYRQARAGFQQHFAQRAQHGTAKANRTFEQAEPNYQTGYLAGRDQRYSGREFEQIEPDLRRDHGARSGTSGTTTSSTSSSNAWDDLREEIREGWNRARNS